eukprot:1697006-Pyramimonas_sp.AAC.1
MPSSAAGELHMPSQRENTDPLTAHLCSDKPESGHGKRSICGPSVQTCYTIHIPQLILCTRDSSQNRARLITRGVVGVWQGQRNNT